MKKLLLVGLAIFGTFALAGCEQIESMFDSEKEYSYDDYRALLADRKLSFEVTKCNSTIDKDGDKTTREYTYSKDADAWEYASDTTVLGVTITTTDTRTLDITSLVKTCDVTAALVGKKVEELFKFYAASDSYRITGSYKSSSTQAEVEYKFRKDGLMSSSYEKSTDLDSIKSSVKKETFSYSK